MALKKLNITHCPTCGSKNLKKQKMDWRGDYKGEPFIVTDLEFFDCPDCGEKIYESEAMRQIEAHLPKVRKSKKAVA